MTIAKQALPDSPLPSVPPQAGETVRYSLAQLEVMEDRALDLLASQVVMSFLESEGNEVCIACPACGNWGAEISESMEGYKEPHKIRCDFQRPYTTQELERNANAGILKGRVYHICDWRFQGCPLYSRDIAAAFALQARVAELGLENEFIRIVLTVIAANVGGAYFMTPREWLLANASSHSRTLAAILAIQEARR